MPIVAIAEKLKATAAFIRQRWYLEAAGLALLSWVAAMGPPPDWEIFAVRFIPPFLAGVYVGAARITHPFRWGFILLLIPLISPFLPTAIPFAFDVGIIVAEGEGGNVYVSPSRWADATLISVVRTVLWLPIVMLGVWAGVEAERRAP